jgi:hypothetical protein
MPQRHVTITARGSSVRHHTSAEDPIMRDLIADWRRWTRAERFLGVMILGGGTTIAALPYFFAA